MIRLHWINREIADLERVYEETLNQHDKIIFEIMRK